MQAYDPAIHSVKNLKSQSSLAQTLLLGCLVRAHNEDSLLKLKSQTENSLSAFVNYVSVKENRTTNLRFEFVVEASNLQEVLQYVKNECLHKRMKEVLLKSEMLVVNNRTDEWQNHVGKYASFVAKSLLELYKNLEQDKRESVFVSAPLP